MVVRPLGSRRQWEVCRALLFLPFLTVHRMVSCGQVFDGPADDTQSHGLWEFSCGMRMEYTASEICIQIRCRLGTWLLGKDRCSLVQSKTPLSL